MLDGLETDRAVVDGRALIKRLNIKTPFSETEGEVCYGDPLVPTYYKGMKIYGKPRQSLWRSNEERYWFRIRGSLIKLANGGLHNNSFKEPFEALYAFDDLITNLRLNAFLTPVNGLELSVTLPTDNPEQYCNSIVSYLNNRPIIKTISRQDCTLPYAEDEKGEHTLRLYAPTPDSLRIELHVDKMQFLADSRPYTFADLVEPRYAEMWAGKLLYAFEKIIWKCPNLNTDKILLQDERELYLRGLQHDYWQVRRQDYKNETEFKRIEKQRLREKKIFNELVQRYWQYQPPTELAQRLLQRLNLYAEQMHSNTYQELLKICLERWNEVCRIPPFRPLPNRLKLPPLSEIYPLYLDRFPTAHFQPTNQLILPFDIDRHQQEEIEISQHRYGKRVRAQYHNLAYGVKREQKLSSRLICSLDEYNAMISAKARLSLTIGKNAIT